MSVYNMRSKIQLNAPSKIKLSLIMKLIVVFSQILISTHNLIMSNYALETIYNQGKNWVSGNFAVAAP